MITFKYVEWQNFLSTGDNPVRIELQGTRSTLIVGENGAGKSTMLDALSFGLFGKPHRSISKKQVINSVNGKKCLVTVEFETSGHDFKIVRGIKPNTFEIWQDGLMIDQSANARDYQKFLEQNILKLNHKSFHQIVVLGSSSFIPFMQLPPKHRREVIEDLLDVSIFSSMKTILKERTANLSTKIKDTKALLDVSKSKYDSLNGHIKDMEKINKQSEIDNDAINAEMEKDIKELTDQGIKLSKEAAEYPTTLMEDLEALSLKTKENHSQLGEIRKAIRDITEEHMFYMNNDSCPTCSQDLSQELKDDRVQTIKDSAKVLSKTKKEIEDEDQEVADETMAVQVKIDTLASIQAQMKSIHTNIEMLKNSMKDDVQKIDLTDKYEELKTHQVASDEYRELFDEYSDDLLYAESAKEMLKDTGIRTKVVREYLPAMNLLINQYLQTLDFFVHFELDENFDETIRSRHRDTFTYANFSEGEKMRIDLALLFAWRQIAKRKNSTNTNLLILDETFDSSLDNDGVNNLMKILYSLDANTNTFIISHKPDVLESKLDSKITFKKVNNFSKIIQ